MYYFLINPYSRSGRGKRIWKEQIKPILQTRRIPYHAYFSKQAGDMTRLAEQITDSFMKNHPQTEMCRLILLGGDGTLNEVVQGIVDFDRVLLGYIPTGSSNDFARDMGISKDPVKALLRILDADQDSPHLMDLGIMETASYKHSFIVGCGLGFDAAVCEEVQRSHLKNTLNRIGLGKLTYLGIAVKQLFAAKKVSCEIYLDQNDEPLQIKRLLFVATMNHRYEGGGFKFCPEADHADGIFDLCVVGNLPKFLILLGLPTAFFGKHYWIPGIDHYRAKEVQIRVSAPLWLQTDGEVHPKTDTLKLTCFPRRIRFLF